MPQFLFVSLPCWCNGFGHHGLEFQELAASRAPIDRPVAVVDGVGGASPATYYVHTDHLHRPIKMSDASKAMQWSAELEPRSDRFAPYLRET